MLESQQDNFNNFTLLLKIQKRKHKLHGIAINISSKDGSVVKWTGNESSDSPHSITQVTAAPSNVEVAHDDHHHDTKVKTTQTEQTVANTKSEKSGSQTTVITLSILAIILSVVSLIITFRRK